jgi:transposase
MDSLVERSIILDLLKGMSVRDIKKKGIVSKTVNVWVL